MEIRDASASSHSEETQKSYDSIGSRYDSITSGEDYDSRCSQYLELIRTHGAPGKRLVDLACGTGKASFRFAEAGFTVTGVDFSDSMLAAARAKPSSTPVRFTHGDLRRLPNMGSFDVAVMLGTPLNYMNDEVELQAAFEEVSQLLDIGGLFLFDFCTLAQRESLMTEPWVFDLPETMVVMRGSSAESATRMRLRVDHFASGGNPLWTRTTFEHTLSYFSVETVNSLVRKAGMTPLERYGMTMEEGAIFPVAGDDSQPFMLIAARKNGESPAPCPVA